VISRAELLAMQASLEDVHVASVTERYMVDLVQATRADHRVALGASPRGTLALLKLARALAALRRRDFALPDDVKGMAIPALAHRLILRPELWASRVSAAQVIGSLLAQVPAPGPEAR
jgi:MoxR-like ATPase